MLRLSIPCLALVSGAAVAQDAPRPSTVQALLDCRTLTDGAARLACFDAAAAAFSQAEASREVIVVDKAEVDRRERERFGTLRRTSSALVGTEGQELNSLDTTVAAVNYTPFGKLILRLADGGVWTQIDSRDLPRAPTIGTPVAVRKATLGSYLVNVDSQTAIRMRRTN